MEMQDRLAAMERERLNNKINESINSLTENQNPINNPDKCKNEFSPLKLL